MTTANIFNNILPATRHRSNIMTVLVLHARRQFCKMGHLAGYYQSSSDSRLLSNNRIRYSFSKKNESFSCQILNVAKILIANSTANIAENIVFVRTFGSLRSFILFLNVGSCRTRRDVCP